jgi:uncharacterized membrane protein
MTDQAKSERGDQILRFWTPVLLRAILLVSVLLLLVGLCLALARPSSYYMKSFESAQQGLVRQRTSLPMLLNEAVHGNPDAVMIIGLMVLTLVPLARVVLCLWVFLREGDLLYVLFTAYVLVSLILGVFLGRIG